MSEISIDTELSLFQLLLKINVISWYEYMAGDIPSTVIENPGDAYLEAQAIKNEVSPQVKRAYSHYEKASPENEALIKPLKETAYLELGSNQLDEIRKQNPDYYYALMERRDAIARLAATLKPAYSEIRNYHNPRIAEEQADSLPTPEQLIAEAKAQQAAEATIDIIVDKLNKKKESNSVPTDDRTMMKEVTTAILEEMEDGHTIDRYYVRAPQIGALTEGIWATLEAEKLSKRLNVDIVTDVGTAIKKQELFNQSQANKST